MNAFPRVLLCFVVLPLLPLVALLLLPEGNAPHVLLDPIAVFVYAVIVGSLISAAIASGRGNVAVVVYAVTTCALSFLPVAFLIARTLVVHCGDNTFGAC